MGVILKYKVAFAEVGLKVSNDAFSGDFLLDADIKVDMQRGAAGTRFMIVLYNLPQKKAQLIYDHLKSKPYGTVSIQLGYSDGAFSTVVMGLYTRVEARVQGEHLLTTISGLETGTHALEKTRTPMNFSGKKPFAEVVTELLKNAKITQGEVERTPVLQDLKPHELEDRTLRGRNLLEILDEVARVADAELLVSDGKVHIGQPVKNDSYANMPPLDPDRNLAEFRPFLKSIPGEAGVNRLKALDPLTAQGFRFIIAGDPKLRPGHRVTTKLEGFKNPSDEYRIHSLVHSLSLTGGYICEGVALKVCKDERCRKQEEQTGLPSADAIARSLAQRIQQEQERQPTLEIAQIKQYTPGSVAKAGHRATLYFGQRFPKSETQPSARSEVERDEQQVTRNKPLVSPFAWRKCGLVVPVYPGMRALLGHNLNLSDDALVMGFAWSEKPDVAPPANKEGDWWLCLPVDVGSSSPPADGSAAANDLTAGDGRRIIQVKGLKITVGSAGLGAIGTRPSEGDADECLIEHPSGAQVLVKEGEIRLTAGGVTLKVADGVVSIS